MLKNFFLIKRAQSSGLIDIHTVAMLVALTLFGTQAPFAVAPVLAAETDINAVVDYAKKKGVQVIIVSPAEKTPQKQQSGAGGLKNTSKLLADFKRKFSEILSNVGASQKNFAAAVERARPKDGASLIGVLALLIGFMVLAHLVERWHLRWVRNKIKQVWLTTPRDIAGRTAVVLIRFLGRAAGVILFSVIAVIFAALIVQADGVTELTTVAIIGGVVVARVLIEFWRVWLSPSNQNYRLVALGDSDARTLFLWLAGSVVLIIGLGTAYTWFEHFELEHDTFTLIGLFSATAVLVFHLAFVTVNRSRVAAIISGANARTQTLPTLTRLLAANWHLPFGVYFIAAWIAVVVRLVLDRPNAFGLSGGMIIVLMASLALYGVGIVLIHVLFDRRRKRELSSGMPATEQVQTTGNSDAQPQESEPEAKDDSPVTENDYEILARRILAMVVIAFALGATLSLWGANPLRDESLFVRLWEVIFVAILGYVVFQVTKISIGKSIAEREVLEQADLEGKGAQSGLSRLATLLPLFRNFVLVTIAVITVMIGLSELGVDIGPLFAGAGIIGVALGFGAQTMVKDILSGAFFLADDAFRKGEHIQIGDADGIIEKINIRSLQMRHVEGPLYTVPYGEIKTVTNRSRDWSLMRLKLRVTYDTDIEKVRPLIRKLGKELMDDPQIGHMFLEPLKSQGVYKMEDSAMILRVKFKTRPGDQYSVRTKVYSRIRELFKREGIEFATRQVTVRLADENKDRKLDDKAKREIAGAALPATEKGTAKKSKSTADL